MNIRMKATLVVTGIIMYLVFPGLILAQTASASPNSNQIQRLSDLHTKCDSDINQRLTGLNSAQSRISGLAKLSPAQKNQFSSEIQADVTGLTTLKTKCDGDTDLKTLRADYQSVFTQFRIYAVFLPQLNLLAASDTMDVTTDKLSDLANKLQTRIQSAGNPSNLSSLLSDMNSKVTDARLQYQNVQSQITPLTPNSFNTDPNGTTSTEQNARSEIKTGASDLQAAFSDAKQIIQALKGMHNPPTPSAS